MDHESDMHKIEGQLSKVYFNRDNHFIIYSEMFSLSKAK